MDPLHPEYGTLREYLLEEPSCEPQSLVGQLREDQLDAYSVELEQSGVVNLYFSNWVGRAKCTKTGDGVIWVIVLADPKFASTLDPDALLTSLLPAPTLAQWGSFEAEVLGGGQDGSPWGEPDQDEENGWWETTGDDSKSWGREPGLVGNWEGSTFLKGKANRVRIRFEEAGTFVVEMKEKTQTTTINGEWHTRQGILQLHSPEETALVEFNILGNTLSLINYRNANLTLYKQ